MKERIKLIRKNARLTQDEFSKRIGSNRNTLATYETGRSMPSAGIFASICREFNVNEEWLRYGVGNIYKKNESDELDSFVKKYNLDNASRILIEKFAKLDASGRKAVLRFCEELVAEIRADGDVSCNEE